MKFVMIYLLTLILFLLSFERANASVEDNFEYFGADNREAAFVINGRLTVAVPLVQKAPPTRMQVDPLMKKQMRYMLGLMRSRTRQAAALYPKYDYTIIASEKIQPPAGITPKEHLYSVEYALQGKGVFSSEMGQYSFTIPFNPQTLFAKAAGKCGTAADMDESNYWYHWEPLTPGCPLIENQDYFNYNAVLRPINNTVQSFPEYEKLPDASKTIKITLMFGFEKYDVTTWDPAANAKDWGVIAFTKEKQYLESLGFKATAWTAAQIAAIYRPKDKFVPTVYELNLAGTTANIRVRMVLANTGLYHDSAAFHAFLRDSLLKESVVVYNGHSGIGKNLDLASIEKMRGFKFVMNPKYQILFLGSCVPYAYYTDMFFARKQNTADPKGSRFLDIFTYGKESIFANQEDYAFTRALVKWAKTGERTSYQAIIRSSPNFFFGINGDEDNPIK